MNDCQFCKKHLESIMACEDCIDGSDFEPIDKVAEVKNKLSNLMKMLDNKQSDDLTNYLNNTIDAMTKEVDKHKDFLFEYKDYFNSSEPHYYFLDAESAVDGAIYYCDYNENNFTINPYCNYPLKDYAFKAQKLKKFDDMLLAFKYCYDRDYKPSYATEELKYYIYYNNYANAYRYERIYNWIEPIIYFSSEKIADKCCDWLNEIDPNGELIMVS